MVQKRGFTRIKLSERATIRFGEQSIGGMLENISLRGLFVHASQQIPLDIPIEVNVHLPIDPSLVLNATVVRHDEESGLGMRINRIDMRSLLALRNLVEKHCGDRELVSHETKKMVGYLLS
jgi:hypothetical protein